MAFTVVEPTSSPTRNCCINSSPESGSAPDSVPTTRTQIDRPVVSSRYRSLEMGLENAEQEGVQRDDQRRCHYNKAQFQRVPYRHSHHATCSDATATRV